MNLKKLKNSKQLELKAKIGLGTETHPKNSQYLALIAPIIGNNKFMLDEMSLRNASKFAIILEYENPLSCFSIHFMQLYFFL